MIESIEPVESIEAGMVQRAPRVAVIGVHGIARHPAGETENAMADLLLSLPAEDKDVARRYEPFKAVGIQIPLQRVREPLVKAKQNKASFREASVKLAAHLSSPATREARAAAVARRPATTGWEGTETGNDYTRLLLQGYQGGADTNAYITTRLEGKRKAGAGQGEGESEAKVHIYEVLWADLAHPESNVVGFFLSFFTLLLHLASLSRLAVDSGAGENSGLLCWLYAMAQRWAVRMLQIFVPLFKVLLLVVVLSAIPGVSAMLSGKMPAEAFAAGLGALGGTVVGFFVYKSIHWPLGPSPWLWALGALLPGTIGACLGYELAQLTTPYPQIAGSIGCWVFLGAPILWFILSKYENYRTGVLYAGVVGYLLCLGTYIFLLRLAHHDVSVATFWLTEFVVAAIRASWLLMSLLAVIALVLGSLICLLQRDDGKRARLRAAVRTSRFALAMPAVFFLLVTPLLWAALFQIAKWVRNPFFYLTGHENDGNAILRILCCLHLIPDARSPEVFRDYLKSVLGWGLGYQLPITLVLVSLAMFLLVWWAVPSAVLETYPQRDKQVPPRSSTNGQTMRLGNWLSRGLDGTSVITFLFWCSIFLALPAVYLLGFIDHDWARSSLHWLVSITNWIVETPLLAVSGVVLVTVVKYGSSAVETILDVDTYLRAAPEDATPRAKIFERFVSTLRYVANYREADGRGYDSVVIVAHSLGSLIAADLLRYLYVAQHDPADRADSRRDPALARFGFAGEDVDDKIHLKLLTMGSPVRQLLNRFFPFLYDWVRPDPDNGLAPLPNPAKSVPAPIHDTKAPDPAKLGLVKWVNTYRSGDYVGRSLWLDEWYKRNGYENSRGRYPEPIEKISSASGLRLEMCIGAGAHTHYWDDTAPDVAEALNSLI